MGAVETALVPVQKGALTELAVANAIQILTRGALRCARPQPDDHGQDYRVYRSESAVSLGLQVKSAFAHDRFGAYQFLIDTREIPADARHLHIAFVIGTSELPGIAREVWLVPAGFLVESQRKGPKASVKLFPKRARGSKYDRYRIDLFQVGSAVAERLRALSKELGVPPPPAKAPGISRVLAGKVAEDAVAHLLVVGSDGRLSVQRPMADTVGLDLSVLSFGEGVRMAAQVKSKFLRAGEQTVSASVPLATFRARPDRMVVVVGYLPSQLTLAPKLWCVPSVEFALTAPRRAGHLIFSGSLREGASDPWTSYRYRHTEVAALFERALIRS